MTFTRGLFFTSIPKAGKNLIYSFLAELGYTRAAIARDPALWHVEQPWLEASGRQCTYALPPAPADRRGRLPGAFEEFADAITKLPPCSVLHHHFPYHHELARRLAEADVPMVFVFRDPRDLLVSMADYILVQKKPAHLAAKYAQLDRSALIQRLWHGDDELISLCDYFESFSGWRNSAGVVALSFERLIGADGGGTASEQEGALRALTSGLGVVDEEVFARACQRTFNRAAGTFYKGRKQRWREENEAQVVALLRSPEMEALAAAWGYRT